MTDIVERLRKQCICPRCASEAEITMRQAADKIEELKELIEWLNKTNISEFKEMRNEKERFREAAEDLAQYVSRADWSHYVKAETRAALGEKE